MIEKSKNLSPEWKDIATRYELQMRDVTYIELKLLSHTNEEIAEKMGIGVATVYRIGSQDKIKLAMAELTGIALSDSVLSLGTVMSNAINLYNEVITNPTMKLELRLSACDSVSSAFFKLSQSEREARILDVMLGQMNPTKQASRIEAHSPDDFMV